MNLAQLDLAVRAACPIAGLSSAYPIGQDGLPDRGAPAVVTIAFADEATPDQRVAALAVLQSFDPDTPTADDVRAEAQRRMIALVAARDAAHLSLIIANGTREAVRLLRRQASWTEQDAARAATLQAVDEAIEAIRAASNAMEPSPPADYADDARWPA